MIPLIDNELQRTAIRAAAGLGLSCGPSAQGRAVWEILERTPGRVARVVYMVDGSVRDVIRVGVVIPGENAASLGEIGAEETVQMLSPNGGWVNVFSPPTAKHSSTDCRSPEGIAVGLIDGIINNLRVLRRHYSEEMEAKVVGDAIDDLLDDEDLKWILLQGAPTCHCGAKSYAVVEGGGWTRTPCCGSL